MLKKVSIFMILLFIQSFIYAQSNQDELYDDLYGIGNYDYQGESDFFESLYTNGLYDLLLGIKDGTRNIKELNKYIKKMDDDSLEGTCFRDSILCFIGFDKNRELIQLLKENSKNDSIKYVLKIRKNITEYINTNFNFSTAPKRIDTPLGVNMVLPSSDWKISGQETDYFTIIAGDDNYSGVVHIKKIKFKEDVDEFMKNNFYSNYTPTLLINVPKNGKIGKIDMIDLESVNPRLIKRNYKLNTALFGKQKKFDFVYEQIICSPQKYNLQIHISRTRFYIEGNNCIVVSISSYTSGNHALADRRRLVKKYGQILDSVSFK